MNQSLISGRRALSPMHHPTPQASPYAFKIPLSSARLCRQAYFHKYVNWSVKQFQNLCPGPPLLYQVLSMCHDWPVKLAIVNLPIRLKGNLKSISSNSLSLFGTHNKDISPARQTSLTGFRLRLRNRVAFPAGIQLNPLSPKSDQHQISPCNINAL